MVLEHYKTELELAQYVSKLEAQVNGYKALCERLQAQADEMRSGRTPDVSAMARVLSDRAASACCVDPDDNWKIYGHEFIEDVRAMLAASPTTSGDSHD